MLHLRFYFKLGLFLTNLPLLQMHRLEFKFDVLFTVLLLEKLNFLKIYKITESTRLYRKSVSINLFTVNT